MDQLNPDITAASVTKMKPQKSKSVSLATDEIYILNHIRLVQDAYCIEALKMEYKVNGNNSVTQTRKLSATKLELLG
jgi:hypothetical protein